MAMMNQPRKPGSYTRVLKGFTKHSVCTETHSRKYPQVHQIFPLNSPWQLTKMS